MSKFKVGDKVVVNGYSYIDRSGIVTWVDDNGIMVDSGLSLGEHKQNSDQSEFHLYFRKSEASLATTNTLQVGETYTSENGSEWECIFIRDGKAWMLGVYPDGVSGSAYDFDIDGTASWAGGHGADGYNIKWGPKRETKRHVIYVNGEKRETEFDVVDGAVDWGSLRVLPCD